MIPVGKPLAFIALALLLAFGAFKFAILLWLPGPFLPFIGGSEPSGGASGARSSPSCRKKKKS